MLLCYSFYLYKTPGVCFFLILFLMLLFQEWGKAYQISDVKIDWFFPGEANIAYVQHLIEKYLEPELETVRSYVIGKLDISR